MIGSTDSHTGLSTADEDNFFGKITTGEPSAERLTDYFIKANQTKSGLSIADWEVGASGRVAVWATENSREAIWDATVRKEVYATTGTRMTVRFFGGFDFEPGDANGRYPTRIGYEKGVPMGANLDRVQVIKGWLDTDGKTQERIYDVAVSGDRKIGADGRCKTPVGSTVDVANATWTNTIGAGEMITVWKDPDFDPAQRWTANDAKYHGTKPLPGPKTTLTERAYTSPIWYTPGQ
jgi:hypothetical protein